MSKWELVWWSWSTSGCYVTRARGSCRDEARGRAMEVMVMALEGVVDSIVSSLVCGRAGESHGDIPDRGCGCR